MASPFTHYNLRNPLFQYAPICAAVLGAEIQSELVDLTTDRDAKIPMTTHFAQVKQPFSNTSGTSDSSVTVALLQSGGPKIEYVVLEYKFPEQYATRKQHTARYKDLPGIAIVESIETHLSNSNVTERLNGFGIIHRLVRHYGIEWFDAKGVKMLGGDLHTGSENQEPRTYLKYSNTFNTVDFKQNKLLPGITIQLVLPIHLLLGRELFCMDLATESPIEVKISFSSIENAIEYRGTALKLEKFNTDVNMYVSSVRPNEDDYVFDRLPYSLSTDSKPYYISDLYVESTNKSQPLSMEQSSIIKPKITKSVSVFISPEVFTKDKECFGFSCEDATNNYLGGLFQLAANNDSEQTKAETLCLNTGFFLLNDSKVYKSTINVSKHTSTSISLTYTRSNAMGNGEQTVTITTTVPWTLLPKLYLNLNLSYNLLPPTTKFAPTLFAFRTFNLNFTEYDPQHPIYGPLDETNTERGAIGMVSGFYKVTGQDAKDYAFVNITNAILNTVVMSKDTWDLCISAPVPEPHNSCNLIRPRHVSIRRHLNLGLTLDGTQPIVVREISFDEATGQKTILARDLQFSRPLHQIPNRFDPNVEFENSYVSGPEANYKDSRGYRDYRLSNSVVANKLIFKYEDIPLIIDGKDTNNSYYKENAQTDSNMIHTLQIVRRHMKYQQGYLALVGTSEIAYLNQQVTNNVLIPLGMGRTAPDEDMEMPVAAGVPALRGALGTNDEDLFGRAHPSMFSNHEDNASLHPTQVLSLSKQQRRNLQFANVSRGISMPKQVTYADDYSWMPPQKKSRQY